MISTRLTVVASALLFTITACSAGSEASAATQDAGQPPAASPAAPAPTGNVITVEMKTDGAGNFFTPPEITAKRGDVIRYVLAAGVHNVNFPADSNPGAKDLPGMGPMLQLPGQTYDVPVNLEPGEYYFHCDPHALLGMVGHITVTE